MTTQEKIQKLCDAVLGMAGVTALAISGGSPAVPPPNGGDMDWFVYGSAVPPLEARHAAYAAAADAWDSVQMKVCEACAWGTGDIFKVDGVDVMFMYFTYDEVLADLESCLSGKRLQPEGAYYPIGRCATLQGLWIARDTQGFLAKLKERLKVYPPELKEAMLAAHLPGVWDDEDFARAAARQDVLFYHQVLERALDHFLQALFACNEVYFPSRKRSPEWLAKFSKKPERCEERLLEIIRLSASGETVAQSCAQWRELTRELQALV
ncbi:MAG: DUF4037 domain-containing protein [Eubacteriales bacterium]|nr:DUF4037 domain-containing protein [Eubacteriales bacterium]